MEFQGGQHRGIKVPRNTDGEWNLEKCAGMKFYRDEWSFQRAQRRMRSKKNGYSLKNDRKAELLKRNYWIKLTDARMDEVTANE